MTTGEHSAAIPSSPAGDQARWLLTWLTAARRNGPASIDLADVDTHFARQELRGDVERLANWMEVAGRLGDGTVVEAELTGVSDIRLLVEVDGGRRYWLAVAVEAEPPHRIERWGSRRALPAGLVIRDATPADVDALAELELRDPIVVGGTTMTVDRRGHYYEFARLMEGA